MIRRLILSASAFQTLASALTANPERVGYCRLGVSRMIDAMDFLAPNVSWFSSDLVDSRYGAVFRASALPGNLVLGDEQTVKVHSVNETVAVSLGVRGASGLLSATCLCRGGINSLDRITIVDAGLPSIQLRRIAIDKSIASDSLRSLVWSRTIGALGETA